MERCPRGVRYVRDSRSPDIRKSRAHLGLRFDHAPPSRPFPCNHVRTQFRWHSKDMMSCSENQSAPKARSYRPDRRIATLSITLPENPFLKSPQTPLPSKFGLRSRRLQWHAQGPDPQLHCSFECFSKRSLRHLSVWRLITRATLQEDCGI